MLIRTPAPSAAAAAAATVSPSVSPSSSSPAAPWRALFLQHLSQMSAPVGAISTVHPSSDNNNNNTCPRVRHCVFRGLWASLPDRKTNPAPRNPPVYESDLPVFTTDARMAKAWELGQTGGVVEAVWWAPAAGVQWRVRGRAWLLGADVEGPGDAGARAAIEARMRARTGSGGSEEGDGTGSSLGPGEIANAGTATSGPSSVRSAAFGGVPGVSGSAASTGPSGPATSSGATPGTGTSWNWSREVTAHFGNMSPAMRGSFRNPPPGQPRPAGPSGTKSHLGQPVADDDLDNPTARANFRVCVIVPEQVDKTDLSKADDPRRWVYTYVGPGGSAANEGGVVEGEWEKLEVWP